MKADAKTEASVMDTLNKLKEAYARRDVEAILALSAPDPDVVAIGTGADEKCIGLAEIKARYERDFAQSASVFWKWGWHLVSAAGSVAWVAADATIHATVGRQELSFPIRFTAVLVQHGDSWLLAQQHVSIPSAGQSEGESSPT